MKKTLAAALILQALSIVVLIVLSLQFFKQLAAFADYSSQVEHTHLVIYQLSEVEKQLVYAETSSRGYIITRKASFLEPLNEAKKSLFPAMDSLRKLIADNNDQKKLFEKVEKLAFEKMVSQLENSRFMDRFGADSLMKRMDHGKVIMDELIGKITDMKANEMVLLEQRRRTKQYYENSLPESIRVVFLIAGLSTLIFGFWIFIELKKRFRFQDLLQHKLVELRQNNEELEQIAFAASHDLQEPLRKIRIFSDRLLTKMKDSNDKDNLLMAQRMNLSAARLQQLINDLVEFNKLVQNKQKGIAVSLDKVIEEQETAFNEKGETKPIVVEKNDLPVVVAPVEQLTVLFHQLFANSSQFSSPERSLIIQISCNKTSGKDVRNLPPEMWQQQFHHVKFTDNGIGFDETFKDKMFKLFQRLHNYDTEQNSRRKGMGLAMCKRVMLNLGGWIDAEGKVGKGAVIHLYFPVA